MAPHSHVGPISAETVILGDWNPQVGVSTVGLALQTSVDSAGLISQIRRDVAKDVGSMRNLPRTPMWIRASAFCLCTPFLIQREEPVEQNHGRADPPTRPSDRLDEFLGQRLTGMMASLIEPAARSDLGVSFRVRFP